MSNIFSRNNKRRVSNNMQNFNLNQQTNPNNGIKFTPLNKEDMAKIQEEIQNNIQKVNKKNKVEDIINISEFLQDEQNSGLFYKELSKTLSNQNDINEIENISKECFEQVNKLEKNCVLLTQLRANKRSEIDQINKELVSIGGGSEILRSRDSLRKNIEILKHQDK